MSRPLKSSHPIFLTLFFALILGLSATRVSANTFTWTGVANNSDWGAPNNWNPVGIPGFGDSVIINFGNVDANMADLTLSALTITAGHLYAVDELRVNSLNMIAGKLTANSLVHVGDSNWSSGEIDASIEVPANVTLSIIGGTTVLSEGAEMTNRGTVRMTGGRIQGFKDCVIHNEGTWKLESTSNINPFPSNQAGNVFHNLGLLTKTGGAGSIGLIWNWTFHLNGETRCDEGILFFDDQTLTVLPAGAQLKGNGTIRFASNTNLNGVVTESVANLIFDADTQGTLNCAAGSAVQGTLEWASGNIQGNLTVASGSILVATGSGSRVMKSAAKIDNDGTLRWQATSPIKGELNNIIHNHTTGVVEFAADGEPFDNVGTGNELINEGLVVKSAGAGGLTTCNDWTYRQRSEVRSQVSTLVLAGTQVFEGTSTVTGSGAVSIEGSTQLPGAVTFSAPTTWKSGTWTGTGGSIGGVLGWTGGTSAGNWQVAAGGTLDVMIAPTSNNQINGGSEIGIAGLLKLSSGILKGATTSSRIRVLTGGELRAAGTTVLDEFSSDKPQLVVDAGGSITSLASGNLRIDWTMETNGSVLVANGLVKCNGGGSATGSFEATGNGSLQFTAGIHTLSTGAEIKGSGGVLLAGGTLAAASAVNGTIGITGGILQSNSPGGEFRFKNTSLWTGGTLKGACRVLGGATLAVSGTATKSLDTAELQNSGSMTVTGSGNLQSSNSIIRNLAGGTLSTTGPVNLASSGGSNQLINEGTLRIGIAQSKLTVGYPFAQTASGRLEIGVAGSNSVTPNFDILAVSGTATLAGTLAAVLEGGYQPPVDATFQILTSSSRIGTFTNLQAAYFNASYPAQTVVLVAKNPASYDYQAWADSYGLQGADATTDADKDGDGSNNLVEYALNMNPNASELPPIASTLETISGVPSLVIRYRRWNNRIAAGLNYGGQWSAELYDWQTTSIIDEPDPGAPAIAGSQARICRVPANEEHQFLRLGFW